MLTWTNEKRKLKELIAWPKNPRQINEEQARRLRQSLSEFGQVIPICIDRENMIIDGHQRKAVWGMADEYGMDYVVDVRVASRKLTDEEQQKLTIFLEKAKGDWDFDALANWFNADDLIDWGFTEKELDLAMWPVEDLPDDPGVDMNRAEELREEWGVETAQLWQLGEHLLFCGSADKAGINCKIAIYDPPFDWSWQQQDNALSWVRWETAVLMGLRNSFPLAQRSDFCHWWVWDSGMARFGGQGYKPMSGCALVSSDTLQDECNVGESEYLNE
jgi:hypothetical protein